MRLRGHHLVCLHFYHGEGYGAEFIKRLDALLADVRAMGVEICEGPDDVCRACPHLMGEVCEYSLDAEGEIRRMDKTAFLLLSLAPGGYAAWEELKNCLPGIFSRWHDEFCKGCDWRVACEKDGWYAELAATHTEP
ncbi:MAG: DUF1284 domain-containing protein [Chloroflexota bacterium]